MRERFFWKIIIYKKILLKYDGHFCVDGRGRSGSAKLHIQLRLPRHVPTRLLRRNLHRLLKLHTHLLSHSQKQTNGSHVPRKPRLLECMLRQHRQQVRRVRRAPTRLQKSDPDHRFYSDRVVIDYGVEPDFHSAHKKRGESQKAKA